MDFISSQEWKTHFSLPDGAERDILSGESVALGIGGGEAFLYYNHRPVGINLDWSEKPKFEWRIIGGEPGTPIPYDSPVAIMNDSVKPSADFLIYFQRPPGMADIGWTTSPEFWDQVLNAGEKALTKAALALLAA